MSIYRNLCFIVLLLVVSPLKAADTTSVVINEIMPLNVDVHIDPSWNYGGFVELYNPTSEAVNLANWYVSCDESNPKMHRLPSDIGTVPAHGFYVLWFDHYSSKYSPKQVNFSLDREGGYICLSNTLGTLVAKEFYPAMRERVSYARTTDGGDIWGLTSEGTPKATNATASFADTQLDAPVVDKPSQLFTSSIQVKVTVPSGCTLRYTVDGSTPTLKNGTESSGKLTISSTNVYRFRLFKDGMLPSDVVTRTYIQKNQDYSLPILSVATANANLYGASYGIMVQGSGNGRTGNGQSVKCNWNMDWDRPVNVEYITENGDMVINQEVNMAMCGGWSRAWDPKSFKLKASKDYNGLNYYPYPLFTNKPYIKNRTLQIRNGGNDNYCRIKDPALQTIISSSGLDVDCQSYQPVMHFINGTYKGVINMREPNNKHFVEANYGYDSDEIDMFEMSPDSGYCQLDGTRDTFYLWYRWSSAASNNTIYKKISQIVDIDEFINYMAVEFYLGNWDWPQNNMKGYRPRFKDGRFRFIVYDLDGAFSTTDPFNVYAGKKTYTFDYIYDTGNRFTKEIEMVTIWLNMLKNTTFRKQFIDAFCMIGGSVFAPERCKEIITELAQRVEGPMSLSWESPWGTANSLISSFSSTYQTQMATVLKQYSAMGLSAKTPITANISSNVEEARILLNKMPIPTGKFSGKLFTPITLTAQTPAGYRFLGWTKDAGKDEKLLIANGSEWKYYDQGSLDGKNWKSAGYTDSGWKSGASPLGYYTSDQTNQRGYKTFLSYGNASNKRPTYYFRQTVQLDAEPKESDSFTLNYTCDDGFIIYVNDKEAGRYLMPTGTVTYNTYATSYAPNNPDNGSIEIDASLFQKGENIIAVEVHNNSAASTDIYWDASLNALIEKPAEEKEYVSTSPSYTLPTSGTVQIIACFEKIDSVGAVGHAPVRINEVSAANTSFVNDVWKKNDWIELYNTTSEDIDVKGMYLSDNIDKPYKYQIAAPSGAFFEVNPQPTVVPANGFLVVWCDKLDPVWQLHANFKLSADGGYVLLSAADKSWTDTLHYSAHGSDRTVGLYPDGGATTYSMCHPTIGASNTITTVDTVHVQQRPADPTALQTPDSNQFDVIGSEYFNLQGFKVMQPQRGCVYIRRDFLSDGSVRSIKVIL